MAELNTDGLMRDFAQQITDRLNEATVVSCAACDLGLQGLERNAFEMLLQLEPLLHEASILLSAKLVVHRRIPKT